MQHAPERRTGDDGLPVPPYKVYNIGNNHPENLLDFVTILQEELVRAGVLPNDYDFEAHKELVPMQPGDVPVTYADTTPLEQDFGFKPSTSLREGLRRFAEWYAGYYKVSKIRNSKKYTLMDNLGYYTTAEEIREVILETIAAHGTIKLATINNQCANEALFNQVLTELVSQNLVGTDGNFIFKP